jgi:hypothetical protein
VTLCCTDRCYVCDEITESGRYVHDEWICARCLEEIRNARPKKQPTPAEEQRRIGWGHNPHEAYR